MQADTLLSTPSLEEVDSEIDFILFSECEGLISEHCTLNEARMARFQDASLKSLGEQLPLIYQRREGAWIPIR